MNLPCPFCSVSVQIPSNSQGDSSTKANAGTVSTVKRGVDMGKQSPSSGQHAKNDEIRRLSGMMNAELESNTAPSSATRSSLPTGRNQSLRTADDMRKSRENESENSDLDAQFQDLIRKELERLQGSATGSGESTPSSSPPSAEATPTDAGRRKPLPPLAQHAEVVPSSEPIPAPAPSEPNTTKPKRHRPESTSLPPLVTMDTMDLDSEVARQWGDQAVVKTGQLNWLAALLILTALGVGIYFGYHYITAEPPVVEEAENTPEAPAQEESPATASMNQQAFDVLHQFHEAVSPEAKSAFVRNADGVLPLMRDYYALSDVESRLINQETLQYGKMLVGKTYFHQIQGEYTESLRMFYADVEETPSGRFLLDWESWVGYSKIPLETFAQQGLTEAEVYRVWVEVRDYYRYAYADAATYRSYLIKDKEEKVRLYAYAENGTPDGDRLVALFRNLKKEGKKRARLMLALRFNPDSDKSRGQVEISRLANTSWVLPSL